ncbi:hypothetical protein FRD82_25895, partial [Mycobacterium tuberculosis]
MRARGAKATDIAIL